MKSGFRDTLNKVLGKYGMLTSGVHGTVWAMGENMWKMVNAMGFRVESGIGQSNYDYIIVSEKLSDIEHILVALTKIDYGCIIIFILKGSFSVSYNLIPNTSFSTYEYKDGKYFGVLLKRKEF